MSASEPEDVRIHRLSRGWQLLCWLQAAIPMAATVGCLAVPHLAPDRFGSLYAAFAGTLVFGWLSVVAVAYALRVRARFVVDEEGMTRFDPDGSVTFLPWDRVDRIRERPLLQRLEVHDDAGGGAMKLEYQLDGFDELAERIGLRVRGRVAVEGRRALRPGAGGAVEFARTPVARAAAPMVAVAAVAASRYWLGAVVLAALLVAGVALGVWLLGWCRIRVGPAGVVIEALARSRRLEAETIRSVDLVTQSDRGNRLLGVVLELVDGTRVRISQPPGGVVALYRAVTEMLRITRGRGRAGSGVRHGAAPAAEVRTRPDPADGGARAATGGGP